MAFRYRAIESATRLLSVEAESFALRSPDDFEPAFRAMTRRRPDALLLVTDALTNMNQKRVVEFAAAQGIPEMYESTAVVQQCSVMSYGPAPEDMFRRAAVYIDLIFKGADASPRKFDLVVSMRTAKLLGLTIPPSLLLRADQVIE